MTDSLRMLPSTKNSAGRFLAQNCCRETARKRGQRLTCHPKWHIQEVELGHGGIRGCDQLSCRKLCVGPDTPGAHLVATYNESPLRIQKSINVAFTCPCVTYGSRDFSSLKNIPRSLACRVVKELPFIFEG